MNYKSNGKFGGSDFHYIVSGKDKLQDKIMIEVKSNLTTITEQTKLLQSKKNQRKYFY